MASKHPERNPQPRKQVIPDLKRQLDEQVQAIEDQREDEEDDDDLYG
jgi:hypothetical protein